MDHNTFFGPWNTALCMPANGDNRAETLHDLLLEELDPFPQLIMTEGLVSLQLSPTASPSGQRASIEQNA